ncbi:DUF3575 domain-containing protein [Flavobacterium sp. 20NA77.7]|uniref:DUF3575 domain-containing protein n=1 Tax=Flavobacterium nakdongensis TaxID=3073563 RepID=A0ABY9RA48_9FLAO|nr:DUF3575 domain-containing protein [Flavobacterium sp. 20NA77.7]WMW77215.1 DUF3575 domain-containing protein [Flavobacterium sp. 20NA77.7]
MKKFIHLFLLCCGLGFAQNHAIKFNPAGFIYKGFEISYETKAENNNSFEIILAHSKFDMNDPYGDLSFYGAEFKYKFFTSKNRKTFEGFYIAPVGTYGEANRTVALNGYTIRKDKANVAGFGAIIGNQWIFQQSKTHGFLLDLNAGFSNYFTNATPGLDASGVKGFKVRLGIALGYAF